MNAEDWTPQEEEYWKGLVAKQREEAERATDPRQWCLEHEDAENLLQEGIARAKQQREEKEAREYQKRHDAAHDKVIANWLLANEKQVGGDHYKNMGVEPWDVVDTWPLEQRIGAYRHGALKYLMRMGSKDEQLQEIRKCGHYIEKLIEVLRESA